MKWIKLACVFVFFMAAALADDRPNIVFLLTDDQRYDSLGATGNEIIHTPEIDALADEGVIFDNSFVVSSACAPNRAAIFSGMYNRTLGVRDFSSDFTPEQREYLYPFLLKKEGYFIGFIGKWGVAATIASTLEPYRERFDYWRGFVGQGNYYTRDRQNRHLTQVLADDVEEFLDVVPKGKPFCLSVSFKAPHGPWNQYDRRFAEDFEDRGIPFPPTLDKYFVDQLPPFMRTFRLSLDGRSLEQFEQFHEKFVREYYRLILGVDEAVGRIRKALEAKGLADNTIIVYASDNGHFLEEWGFYGKWLMYEPSIRVPLIVYDPRLPKEERGKRVKEQVLSVDYAPTFLDWAGADIPERMQGQSLRELVEGEAPDDWREDWFYDYAFEMYPGDIPKSIGVRTDRYKLVRYISPRPQYEQLFDLQRDPLELKNRIDDPEYANIRHDLSKRLSEYRKSLPDNDPDFEEYVNTYEVIGIGADFPDAELDFSEVDEVGQTFTAATDHLMLVEWRWPFFISRYPDSGVDVVLRRGGPEGEILGETWIEATDIYNLNRSRASFEVAGLEPGETLYVGIRPQSKPGKRRIGLWRYTKDCYPGGEAFINGEAAGGDIPLAFVFRK
ncbi:sulfatase [Ruficoccus amylovorans]|uniref:Sulfatase n=1 Tax=Ruficoccus amylovorans TaxID=1804625 RepID=A0A842HCH8_9BACT|nr:sulfatase [Ruficoccus amylovorans]MBC2593899.1 sulfatase [Ruficoccus amylovorans]